ncbi:hypothetical protein CAP47_03630 [Psychroflexus sp. S27]|nr:hypothetical protein CAP47_03630 [Psychroflexus sp. S27]
MKILFIYILSFLSLSQSLILTSTNLYNINELYKHYQLHKAEFNDNVYDFLDEHFGIDRQSHADNHGHSDHENLPFKECQFHTHNHNLALPNLDFDFKLIFKHYKPELNVAYIKHFDSAELSKILQPPRMI